MSSESEDELDDDEDEDKLDFVFLDSSLLGLFLNVVIFKSTGRKPFKIYMEWHNNKLKSISIAIKIIILSISLIFEKYTCRWKTDIKLLEIG